MAGLKILVTSGATREPIDQVRFISNVSTGATGATLADFFTGLGFSVTYLHGISAAQPELPCEAREFSSYADLDAKLKEILEPREFFAVVHLAAISDYSVDEVVVAGRRFKPWELRKIDSGEKLDLILRKNAKIVSRLKEYGGADLRVVAFKLTDTDDADERAAAVERLARAGGIDWIAHNDLSELKDARARGREQDFRLFGVSGGPRLIREGLPGVGALGGALVGVWRGVAL